MVRITRASFQVYLAGATGVYFAARMPEPEKGQIGSGHLLFLWLICTLPFHAVVFLLPVTLLTNI